MRLRWPLLLVLGAISGCGEPDWQVVDLPSSAGGTYKAQARVLSEGAVLHIARQNEAWADYNWLALGQCSNASFFWADERTAILAYDKAELSYFVDEPGHWGGAHVRICNRSTTACPKPISAVVRIPGCDDHSM
ncbi:hypothetical protein [Sphingomonas lacusdianchii]|uniref:hypothetical protein n=1 Tax=Sphingomonas lacusdianchii TaxID=2917992 RepID=UPI001F56B0DC|nr:hypothetical protein [Sphingomonas sp. JXJ CY 53]